MNRIKIFFIALPLFLFSSLSFIFPLAISARVDNGTAPTGITNKAVDPNLGTDSKAASDGTIFSKYLLVIWQALISIGALAVLLNFVLGAINWITAGGDEGKIKKAREQITNAIIGMVILAGSYVLISYIGRLFGLNLLKFSIPGPAVSEVESVQQPNNPVIPSQDSNAFF